MTISSRPITRPNWIGIGLSILGICIWSILLFATLRMSVFKWRSGETLSSDEGLMLCIGAPIYLIMLIVSLMLLMKPFGVDLINDRSFRLRAPLAKTMVIDAEGIYGYSACYALSIGKDWQGIVLYLKNGRHIELNDFSMKSLQSMVDILVSSNIRHLGSEISWYPLMKWSYKFDPK
jgi:hypothetical protein